MGKTKKTPERESHRYGSIDVPKRPRILDNLSCILSREKNLIAVEPPMEARFSFPELLPEMGSFRPDLHITAGRVLKPDGPPDVVVVILPPKIAPPLYGTSGQHGTKELWVIDPIQNEVRVYGANRWQAFGDTQTILSPVLGQLHISVNDILDAGEGNMVNEPVLEYGELDPAGTYTYWNYLRWQFTERVELVRGKIFKMSPAPNLYHQRIVRNVFMKLMRLVEGHPCEVLLAPFDVRLPVPNTQKDSTVVQPDLCVVCDPEKLVIGGCVGAPDLVVEILSPGNSRHEMNTKFKVYEQSGVKEYWIIDFERRVVLLYILKENAYVGLQPFTEGYVIQSVLFAGLRMAVDEIFAQVG